MMKIKNILTGFGAGVAGGMIIDLIFINFVGPSALFTLLGITERANVFRAHAVLGGILGVLFALILIKLPRLNIWLAGIFWGLICLGAIGGIPTLIAKSQVSLFVFISALGVWLIFGFILALAIKTINKTNLKSK